MLAGWYRYWGERIYVSVFSTNCEDTGTWTATYRLSCRSITIETNNIFQKCFISSSNIVYFLRFLISPTFLSASDELSLVWCPECRPLCVTLLQTTRLENNIWYRQHPQMRWCQEIRNTKNITKQVTCNILFNPGSNNAWQYGLWVSLKASSPDVRPLAYLFKAFIKFAQVVYGLDIYVQCI